MNILIALLAVLFIASIGFLVIRMWNLLSSKDTFLSVAYSYGLGVGLISLQLFIFSLLHIQWSREYIVLPWLLLTGIYLVRNTKSLHVRNFKKPKFDFLSMVLISCIVLTCSYVVFEALLRPATAMDTWGFWLFESKAFFLSGSVDPAVFKITNIDYPPVMHLLGSFIYVMLGKEDDTAVLLTSVGFYLFLTLLFFIVLKKRFGTKYAVLFTFLLVTTQTFVRQGGRLEAGLADLPIGYYSLICVTLLFEYIKTNSKKSFFLLNIFLGITALIKFDGIPITVVVACCVFYHIYKKKLYRHLPFVGFWVLPLVGWQVFKEINGIHPTYFSDHRLFLSQSKTINAFWGTFMEMINVKSWNLLWIIYIVSFFIFGVKKNRELFIINLVVLSQLVIYLSLYVFTVGNAPNSSIERLLVHVAPVTLFYIAILVRLYDKKFLV